MTIRREEVERIAELARLEIPADRIARVADELSRVLEFVAMLDRLDLGGYEPSEFAPADVPLRDDVPDGECLDAARATAMAPAAEDGYFLVPPIVENVNP
ncbi:MAG: Asp-tRNA(Asn)/Glu-tRNA(Gln) amidotransferase subunit GatC [Candidatus Eisenbacteria bacterium]